MSAETPDALERLFAVVVEKARQDAAFAAALRAALEPPARASRAAAESVVTPFRAPKTPAREPSLGPLADFDAKAIAAEKGLRGLHAALGETRCTVAHLRAFARAHDVSLRGAGRRKADIVQAILTHFRPPRASAFG